MARTLMVPIRESVSSSKLTTLRVAAAMNGLGEAFRSMGKAAAEAVKINWPAEMLTDEKLSLWSSQDKHGL